MRRHRSPAAPQPEIAACAARLLIDGGADDFSEACERAVRQLALPATQDLPSNLSVHRELVQQLKLFHYERQHQHIKTLRQHALKVMQRLSEFDPRLVGPVYYGTALEGDPIEIHIFCDEFERITRLLMERKVRFDIGESRFRFGRGLNENLPQVGFDVLGEPVVVSVLPTHGQLQRPLSSLDQRPMKRLSIEQVQALLNNDILFPLEQTA